MRLLTILKMLSFHSFRAACINPYEKIRHSLASMRQIICIVINQVTVVNYAAIFGGSGLRLNDCLNKNLSVIGCGIIICLAGLESSGSQISAMSLLLCFVTFLIDFNNSALTLCAFVCVACVRACVRAYFALRIEPEPRVKIQWYLKNSLISSVD